MIFDELVEKGLEKLNSRELEEAKSFFNKALEKESDSFVCYNNLGMVSIFENKIEEAISFFEKAIKLNPKSSESYQNLGSCLLYLGDIEKAEAMYLRSLQFDADNINIYYNLSTLYVQTEQLSKAKNTLEKLVQLDENNFKAFFMLGTVFLALKEYYPAIANFSYSLQIKADFHDARLGLVDAYHKQGKYKISLRELDYLIKTEPEFVLAYIKTALILIETNLHDKAIPFLEKAIELDDSNSEIKEILGVLYEEFGNRERAKELYQEMLIVNPEHKGAFEGLERIEKFYSEYDNKKMFS